MLDRKVALKTIRTDSFEPSEREEAVQRFLAEARATARLSHPNIVTIYGVGEDQGCPYLALELLAGQTLRERLQQGPLAPADAAEIALGIARALETAHAAGLCHRDLKPG